MPELPYFTALLPCSPARPPPPPQLPPPPPQPPPPPPLPPALRSSPAPLPGSQISPLSHQKLFLLPSVASPARARRRHVLLVAPPPEETRGRHEWHALCLRDLVNRRDAPFDLEAALCSHGLFMMVPNRWDPASRALLRPLRLACKCGGCCGCRRRMAGWWRSSRRCTAPRGRRASGPHLPLPHPVRGHGQVHPPLQLPHHGGADGVRCKSSMPCRMPYKSISNKLAAACTSIVKMKPNKPARGGKRTRASGGRAVPMEKKETEKERRQRMKALCGKLASLIPKEHNPLADTMTQLGSLDVAASYIKKLKECVDELQHRKTSAQAKATLLRGSGISTPTITATTSSGAGTPEGGKHLEPSPLVVEVRQSDDASMEVRLICSTERPIKIHEVITILEEEGAVIINANHSVAAHKIFCTIHSRAFSTRIGIDVSSISKRLGALV